MAGCPKSCQSVNTRAGGGDGGGGWMGGVGEGGWWVGQERGGVTCEGLAVIITLGAWQMEVSPISPELQFF